jgi:hypothetical protein
MVHVDYRLRYRLIKNQPKDQNKSAPDANKNATSKQTKQVETSKSFSFFDLEYDPIEDFKRLKENISIYELLKFPYIQRKMLQSIAEKSNNKKKDSLDKSTTENSSNKRKDVLDKSVPENNNKKKDVPDKSIENLDKIPSDATDKNQQPPNPSPTPRKRSNVPLFLLTFEIFNRNVHNCMVDSGASSNVMPLSVCQKINAEVKPSDMKIIQLDRTNVTVVGELKDVLIRLSSNLKVHQVIDIVVADIPEDVTLNREKETPPTPRTRILSTACLLLIDHLKITKKKKSSWKSKAQGPTKENTPHRSNPSHLFYMCIYKKKCLNLQKIRALISVSNNRRLVI